MHLNHRAGAVACYLLALQLWSGLGLSQTTQAPEFIGYVVRNNVPATTAMCNFPGMEAMFTGSILFCEYTTGTITWIRTGCRGSNVLYSSSTDTMAVTCSDACVPLTVIESWPSGGETWTMYDCLSVASLTEPVGTVYRVIDALDLSTQTDSVSTVTTEQSSETATESSSITTSSGTPSSPAPETDDDSDNGSDGNNGGLSDGQIAGAVVGPVLFVALVAGFLWWRRWARRRQPQSQVPDVHEAGDKTEAHTVTTPPQMERPSVVELPVHSRPAEMQGSCDR
ncbi:hypothetical protein B0I35DRAFT_63643 [Stachybotrys elegans]|uniref:Ig-like domain-containing protein n=1 Tax=Stachybotrys elegans TaxID=80388 RepID=A0A8K0SKZ7_9HYPO|nr:hypothetical protein B0I35DRAFT_63643 [Stachybotrys elegans]